MATPERRVTPRFNLHTPLAFHRWEIPSEGEQRTKAINISTRGVYFATGLAMRVGEVVEVLLEIPRRVTGTNGGIRRFAGRVTHVQSKNMAEGLSGIGVQLLYYERDFVRMD
jgi:hypothetical protein